MERARMTYRVFDVFACPETASIREEGFTFMESSMQALASRREFIKNTGKLAAVSALANVAIPAVHAAGSDEIQVALIGCGGRGGGAAANALSVKRGPVKLVAMADIFPERLNKDLGNLQQKFSSQVDVP